MGPAGPAGGLTPSNRAELTAAVSAAQGHATAAAASATAAAAPTDAQMASLIANTDSATRAALAAWKAAVVDPSIGAGAAYTPTFANFILGAGSIVSRGIRVGRLVHAWGRVFLTSGYAFNSGNVEVSLPYAPLSGGWSDARVIGTWGMVRSGVGYWSGELRPAGSARVFFRGLTASSPVGPSSGDVFTWQLTYESA